MINFVGDRHFKSACHLNKMKNEPNLAQVRTDFALERTHMAATRTYFALLRTGMAIAGGGALVTSILVDGWPEWVVGLLSGVFILVGFIIMIAGLQKYIFIAKTVAVDDQINIISPKLFIGLTVILQVATLSVLVLFLLGD